MKNLFTLLLTLAIPGSLLVAQDNNTGIQEQSGSSHIAQIVQTGNDNDAEQYQIQGQLNEAYSFQTGDFNDSYQITGGTSNLQKVVQIGYGNDSRQLQDRYGMTNNTMIGYQDGDNNVLLQDLFENGDRNYFMSKQIGDGNSTTQRVSGRTFGNQSPSDNSTEAYVVGDRNTVDVLIKNGDFNTQYSETWGHDNSIDVDQEGWFNDSNIFQSGDWNSATHSQIGMSNKASSTQLGGNNTAVVTQN